MSTLENLHSGSNKNSRSAALIKKFQNRIDTYFETQIDPVDQAEAKDPQTCAEYAVEIFKYLRENEDETLPRYGYLENQQDINERMRSILVDWLIEVHLKFKLVPESLFLTVNLIDRYLG